MDVFYNVKYFILSLHIFCHFDVYIEAMGLCEFEERSPCKIKLLPLCSRRGHSTEGVTDSSPVTKTLKERTLENGVTGNISSSTSQFTIMDITPSVKICPTNMVLGDCQSCQATCQDPSGTENCQNVCLHSTTCICPDGFLMNDQDCISKALCPCFFVEAASVIPEGISYIDEECGIYCVCQDSILSCDYNYRCSVNAACENRDGGYRCNCKKGYNGDGITCIPPMDCLDVYHNGLTESGIYTIYPTGWPDQPFEVYCNMEDGGGWTVFQRRFDGHVDFYLDWDSYKEGFGSVDSEFWLGNEKIYYLTNQKGYELRIDMTDKYLFDLYAVYNYFRIEGSSENYKISHLGSYSGSAGHDYFTFQSGMSFSTYDRDNDVDLEDDCAEKHHGAWWYKDCYAMHLNGQYEGGQFTGMLLYNWDTWSTDHFLRKSEMKIRPV